MPRLQRRLFVRHTPIRTARRLARRVAARRALLFGPAVLAGALAMASPFPGGATPVVTSAAPYVAAPAVASHQTHSNVVARRIPEHKAAPKRASRSRRTYPDWVRPAYGPLTSPYGWRWGKLHAGIDIGAPYGAPIYAAAAGVVTYVGPEAGYGRLITIRHADGTVTAYGHMSRYATAVGRRVRAGELIAYVGSAGDATGPHLHFEVRVGGVAIDPRPFLRKRGIRY